MWVFLLLLKNLEKKYLHIFQREYTSALKTNVMYNPRFVFFIQNYVNTFFSKSCLFLLFINQSSFKRVMLFFVHESAEIFKNEGLNNPAVSEEMYHHLKWKRMALFYSVFNAVFSVKRSRR